MEKEEKKEKDDEKNNLISKYLDNKTLVTLFIIYFHVSYNLSLIIDNLQLKKENKFF